MQTERFADMEKLRIFEDLNMMYIRQIALSIQDSDIQKKIDHEIRMRDGACKLLAACSQRDQALEAAKNLLTCNARIMAYMSELQRMKEAQVMQRVQRRPSDAGPMDERLPCKGKVAISDLRIPLMWKDTEYFKNKGELHRCAVFCLLQLGGEIFDTDMVMVDRTLTDICFENTVVFNEASPGFELRVELYSCCSEEDCSAGSTPRKLASKLSSSLGRSAGKKMRAAMEPGGPGSPVSNGGGGGGGATLLLPISSVPGPKYHLLAHTTLSLAHVQDSFRTHDLTITANEDCSFWVPLYGSVCCRLAAQPSCMTQQMMSGRLKVKHGTDSQSHANVYGVLKGTNLFCYHQQQDMDANVDPAITIGINKETRIRAAERDPQTKAQSICISNQYGGEEVTHALLTETRDDTQRWMEAFWQHFYDMSQWKHCCDDLMKIDLPSPKKLAPLTPKQGSLYHEMVIDTSDSDIGSVTDILTRQIQEWELRTQLKRGAATPPAWMALFEEEGSLPTTPQPIPRHQQQHQHQHHHHGYPHSRSPASPILSPHRQPGRNSVGGGGGGGRLISSQVSLTSDSDNSPCSTSPCSRHHVWVTAADQPSLSPSPSSFISPSLSPCPSPSPSPLSSSSSSKSRFRPRTLSLDAKLSTLRGRGGGGGGGLSVCSGGILNINSRALQCSSVPPNPAMTSSLSSTATSASSVTPHPHHRSPTMATLSSSSSASTSSSSSEGSSGSGSGVSSGGSGGTGGGGSGSGAEGDMPFSRPAGARRSLRNLRTRLDPRNWMQSQV
ncbi:rhotekin isoform X2 [Engraulis encrasicolus]|uniref:rhotekin isoform X2 n=1 Tax=Engraulis encrasicolus TaxID=184585 RepID=UPI002FD006C3